MKIVRDANDFCVMVHGNRADTEALWDEIAAVLAPMGLRLSVEKSRVCHIDEGFEFLGFRIQRQIEEGHDQALRLHLAVEEGAHGHHRQGQESDAATQTSDAR